MFPVSIKGEDYPRPKRRNYQYDDGNGIQDLTDLVLALKGMSGLENSGSFAGDKNGDGKIGLAEAIYILQKVVTESD